MRWINPLRRVSLADKLSSLRVKIKSLPSNSLRGVNRRHTALTLEPSNGDRHSYRKRDFDMGRQPTAFDTHREMVKTRKATEASNELLGGISASLSSVHEEMQAVRNANQKSLAIQQDMLERDVMQARLEELIYKADQMVAEFERPDTEAIPSSRYFLLTGLLEAVQEEGISTAVVRGRDNKAALDQVLKRASLLVRSLAEHEEVKEAVAWAAVENQKRLA